jgi:hypothetical protein
VHFDPVVQRHHAPERVEQIVRQAARLRLADEIRPSDAADEKQVPGEEADRLTGRLGEYADVLQRVTRGVQERQRDVADRDLLAVADLDVPERQIGSGAGDDARARFRKLARAGRSPRAWVSIAAMIVAPCCRADAA